MSVVKIILNERLERNSKLSDENVSVNEMEHLI